MREFELYIFSRNGGRPIEWGIKERSYEADDKDYDSKLNSKYGFAALCVKDGKFKMAFCVSFDEKRLESTRLEYIFDEICKFHLDILGEKSKKQMSIKDAFELVYGYFYR